METCPHPVWLAHQTPDFGFSGVGQERRVQKTWLGLKGSQMSSENESRGVCCPPVCFVWLGARVKECLPILQMWELRCSDVQWSFCVSTLLAPQEKRRPGTWGAGAGVFGPLRWVHREARLG